MRGWLDAEQVRVMAVRTPAALKKVRSLGKVVRFVPDPAGQAGEGWTTLRRDGR